MATSTATLQANALKRLQMDYADATLLARALDWLNKAMDRIQGYLPEAEFLQKSEMSIATVDGQATYVLPSDFLELLSLRDDTNATNLDMIPREQFDRNHPDPSTEDEGLPYEYTLEFDRSTTPGTNIIRLAAIPAAAYTLYATMRCFHPDLAAGGQGIIWERLRFTVEDWATYFGSLEFWKSNEYAQWRSELEKEALNATQNLKQLLAIQKPRPSQIRTVLKKSEM
ncbi:MAG: hypothetical protein V2B18_05910 [Pseudomonadota bacterium]